MLYVIEADRMGWSTCKEERGDATGGPWELRRGSETAVARITTGGGGCDCCCCGCDDGSDVDVTMDELMGGAGCNTWNSQPNIYT